MQSNHPFGWLLTALKQETADTEAFIAALLRLGNYLRGLPEAERSLWQQTIYYLHLLIFYRRPIDERPMLNQIVSENHPFLEISEKEKQLMQSMAEHYLQQGETRAKREYILKFLQLRFHNVPEPLVETIRSLDDRNWLETLFEKAATTPQRLRKFGQKLTHSPKMKSITNTQNKIGTKQHMDLSRS